MNYRDQFKTLQNCLENLSVWISSSALAMDVHTVIICGSVFAVSAAVVYLISVFGMRERTYEEAMEEQRRRNQEATQHAKSDKIKKDKKFKKWGKRKEKSEEEKTQSVESDKAVSDENDSKNDGECSTSPVNSDTKSALVKRKVKQKKISVQDRNEECSQHISSSEEADEPPVANSTETVYVVEEETVNLSEKLCKKNELENESVELSIEHISDAKEVKVDIKEVVKSQKKIKKPEYDSDLGSEFYDWNNRILTVIRALLMKSCALSEEEIQNILDSLSAKQKNLALSVRQKSNEKKKTEISSLKKLIIEKEEALKAEQKTSQSVNEKVNDLILDLDEQKLQASITEKSLRDALNQEQQEIKALHGMMQRKREQYSSEISTLQSKMQQIKNKMKEEHALNFQRLQDENNQLQSLNRLESEKHQRTTLELSRLQHDLEQARTAREKLEVAAQQREEELRQQATQLQAHMENMLGSQQEEEFSYQQRIGEMSAKLQQAETARASVLQELQNAQKVCSSMEVDNTSLRQRLEDSSRQISNSEQDILQMQGRLEESNRQQRDLANCLEKMRKEAVDLTNFKREQIQVIQNLKQENEALASQVSQHLADGVDQKKHIETSEKMTVMEIEEHEAILEEKEIFIRRILQELDQCKNELSTLSNELECQRKKNKEINDSHCSLTEALQSTEKKLQEVIKSAEFRVQEAQQKIDSSSKEMQNLLNEQIKEVELALRESYMKELQQAQHETEKVQKEAADRLLQSETEANIRLEEFQESLYGRLSELNSEAELKINEAVNEQELMQSKLNDFEDSLKAFLHNVFPKLHIPDKVENKQNWVKMESEALSCIQEVFNEKSHESKDLENTMKKLDAALKEKSSLASQLSIYENVLQETESILKTLQCNIETEELQYKHDLKSKDDIIAQISNENKELKIQNSNLQVNVDHLKNLKEGLCEIEELKIKLQKEETEKKMLQKKISIIESGSNDSSITFDSFQTVEPNLLPLKNEKKKKARKRGAASAKKIP